MTLFLSLFFMFLFLCYFLSSFFFSSLSKIVHFCIVEKKMLYLLKKIVEKAAFFP